MKRPVPTTQACQRGFTLIELIVTVTLLGVLVTIGIPSFNSFIVSQRVKTATYDLSTAVVLARSEAIKRNVAVRLVPKTPADGWVSGWDVKTVVGGVDTTLQEQVALSGLTVTTSPAALVEVSFARDGRPTFNPALSVGESKAKFTLTGGSNNRCMQIDLTGMPNTKSGAC